MERAQLFALVASTVLMFLVLELVRRRRLLERYALLWIASSIALVILALTSGVLDRLSNAFGVVEGPNALFVIAFVFVLLLLLHFSTVISSLADQTKILAQRQAQLEERLRHEGAADVWTAGDSRESTPGAAGQADREAEDPAGSLPVGR